MQLVLTNAFVSFGAAGDISSSVKSVTLNYAAEMLADEAMGDTARSSKGGLKTWSVDLELYQDFVAAGLDADMWALVGATAALEIRPDAGVLGVDNPKFTGTGILESWPPISGTVGDMGIVRCRINSAGTLTRATA